MGEMIVPVPGKKRGLKEFEQMINNKYSLIDDETGLTIGRCLDQKGLTGSCIEKIDGEDFHKITFVDFGYDEEFAAYCKHRKTYINNVYLTILNDEENPIGSYYFVLKESYAYDPFSDFDEVLQQLEFVGNLVEVAAEESLLVWDMRRTPLAKKNEWIGLSCEQRLAWLEAARLFSSTKPITEDQQQGHYYIDAAHVTDPASFFCALGEAVNGPGGYFGYSLDSLEDCLCGGFGAREPFVIHLFNVDDKMKAQDSFFYQIKEILTERNVTISCSSFDKTGSY